MNAEIDFERLAQELSAARMMLKARVDALEAEIAKIKKRELPGIRKWAESAAQRHMELYDAVAGHPECFEKPKTKILHGIKFGWVKRRGEITWEDGNKVIALIKKHFPDQIEVLIKTSETPVKSGLAQLPAADLKKLGVAVENDWDEVFIKPTDSEIDKIAEAILKDGEKGWEG